MTPEKQEETEASEAQFEFDEYEVEEREEDYAFNDRLDFGRLRSAAEMNQIFAAFDTDRGNADKLNAVTEAIIQNVFRTVGRQFAKRFTREEHQDLAQDVAIKILARLEGSPMHDTRLAAFNPTIPNASFNSYVNQVAYTTAVDAVRANPSQLSLTENEEGVGLLDFTADPYSEPIVEFSEATKAAERISNGPFEAPAVKRGRGRPKQPGLSHLSRRKRQKVKATKIVAD